MNSFIVIWLILFPLSIMAQPPEWTNESFRKMKYPEKDFLSGYASEPNIKKEEPGFLLGRLETYAKNRLNESVIVSVQSVTNLDVTETNNQVIQYFKTSAASYSNLNLTGLKTETFYDTKAKTGYAFVYARKSDIETLYRNKVNTLKDQVSGIIKSAIQITRSGNIPKASELYFSCYPVLRQIEEAQSVLASLSSGKILPENFQINEINTLKFSVDSAVNALFSNQNNTLSDQVYFLVNTLKPQIINEKQSLRLTPFTYQDTRMGSPFSRKLAAELEQKLIAAGIQATTDAPLPGTDNLSTPLLMSGTYWEEGDFIKIVCIVKNIQTAKLIASSEAKISKQHLANTQVSFLPENFQQAMVNQKLFGKDEITGGDLNIELYTNKGADNLIFLSGDKMKLFVKANKECYIRCIYLMADGSKVLLLDNYYISSNQVNLLYELPYEFECAEPFGVETLTLNAQNKPFAPLQIKRESGYDFIVNDLGATLVATRGMKRIDDKSDQKAEKRLIITTIAQ